MRISYSGICDLGLKRTVNQDSIFMYSDTEQACAVFVVADGMGGHYRGELASREIITGIQKWIVEFQPMEFKGNFSKMMQFLQNNLIEISNRIYEKYNQSAICGSTCTLLFIYGMHYGIISVGDSRIYLKKGRTISSAMPDDVWENQNTVRDVYTHLEIENHPNYGRLIKALGTVKDVSLSVKTDLLRGDESFLLCSDGLYKYCPEKTYIKIVKKLTENNLDKSMETLIASAYKQGAPDNISAILVKCR